MDPGSPCTGLQVLIWNQLARGQPELCAVLVAFNSVMQIILYAPLYMLYVNVRSILLLCVQQGCRGWRSELSAWSLPFKQLLRERGSFSLHVFAPPLHTVQVVSGSDVAAIGFWPVARSVLIFLGIPLVAGILLRLFIMGVFGRWWWVTDGQRSSGDGA